MRRAWRTVGPWLTTALVTVEIALVGAGRLSVGDAIVIVVAVEILLVVTAIGRGFDAVRAYRTGRVQGRDGWAAALDALAEVLPRPVARILVIEIRMWVCLFRWPAQRRPVPPMFGYGAALRPVARIVLALVIGEGALVEMVLFFVLGHGSAWVWIALALHVYGLVWIGGFVGSLSVVPHRVDERWVTLNDSVFMTLRIPLDRVEAVMTRHRSNFGRSGLRVVDGAALLGYGDTTVRIVLAGDTPLRWDSSTPVADTVRTIDLTADDPDGFVAAVKART
jgi:hypothetical protein